MTKREKLKQWAYNWCRNDDVPEYAMELFLDAAESSSAITAGAVSESLGDHSVSFKSGGALESAATEYLKNYRCVFPGGS